MIAALDRVHRFVGFFDEIWDDGFVGLLGIPRAAAGRAQAVHDGAQAGELLSGVRGVDHFRVSHDPVFWRLRRFGGIPALPQ